MLHITQLLGALVGRQVGMSTRQAQGIIDRIPQGSRPKYLGIGGHAAPKLNKKQRGYASFGVVLTQECSRRLRQQAALKTKRARAKAIHGS